MSQIEHDELWNRLEQFEFDEGTPRFGFADRLARENGWSATEARRAILEYKRFLYLAMMSGHPVTPSEAVDQVWHLHLTYTRSYWNSLCKEVLEKPLHHNPTEGGTEERTKFHEWYSHTLESYRRLFGMDPPEDIWPSPRDRFRNVGVARWIDTSSHWVIDRHRFLKFLGGSLILLLLLSCALGAAPPVAESKFSWFKIIFAVVVLVLCFALGKNSEGGCGGCGDGGCGGCGCGGCGGCG